MKRCVVSLIVVSLLFWLSACASVESPIPADGVWYCAELQAQFTFGLESIYYLTDNILVVDESKNYVIVNNDKIASRVRTDRGASYVLIVCQEENQPDFYFDEIIYELEFVYLSDTEYVLEDNSGKQYSFVRIGDTPTED